MLVLGLVGTEAELLLLAHYEDRLQLIPLLLIAAAIGTLAWTVKRRDTAGFRAFRTTMVLFVLAGFVGVALHFRGAAEFQLDLDPSIGRWDLVKKVMRVKDPPILAPGVMLQLGLMGLAYAYGNPGAAASEGGTKKERSG
ncbi:MAG: hypothetical protein A3G27_17805 [Betaproteobacteria bacterium RIFCSPLOWO2_12_FULL_66_14]|nr:MAG: hypothetical protein A3G27_17805 [Betaproteobacteria bacterium RIFCSPLOWO2_12_FULL_66_14]